MNMSMTHVKKARIEALRQEFETLLMDEEEPIAEFAGKLSRVVTLWSLGERIKEGNVVAKLLRVALV